MDPYELFERFMLLFLTPQCYNDTFFDYKIPSIECCKYTISKGLGYGILMGSLLIRVPQILLILRSKSVEGLSLLSELLMIIAVFGSVSYGYHRQFPISTYGDSYFLFIQNVIILLLILLYQKKTFSLFISLLILVTLPALLFMDMLSEEIILALNAAQMALSLISKFNQAFVNYRNGSTGKLSPITLWLQFLGCVARIFTSIQETGDFTMILTFVMISLANGILVAQLLYYSNKSKKNVKIKKAE